MNANEKRLERSKVQESVSVGEANEKLLINIKELSALTGIKIGTLYHWVSENRVPHTKLSQRCVRFSVPAIRGWLAELSRPAK
jgi:predicted DNA-binding transcriptional regulator AlpA